MIVFSVKDAEDGDWDIQVVDFTTKETWRLTNDSGAPADDTLPDLGAARICPGVPGVPVAEGFQCPCS